jgi:hypothetical protein
LLSRSIFKPDKRFAPVRRSLVGLPEKSFPAPDLVRLPLRLASTLLIAVGVATCSDTPPVGVKHSSLGPTGATAGRVAFQPVFSAAALQIAHGLSDFGIKYDRVRVVLVRPVADTAKDTTIAFTPGGPDITLNLTVEVRSSDEVFDVGIDYLGDQGTVFRGHGRVRSHAPDQPPPPQEQISIDYVGPGANVTRIVITPKTITVPSDQAAAFAVAAFDASNNPVATVPTSWTTSDPGLATITSAGSLHPLGRRGNVVVSAVTPAGVTDQATAAIVPLPVSVSLVAGGGQRGSVGASLAAPAVIQVNAADGLGVPGVDVVFSSPLGGRVSATAIKTDADGRASTALALGTIAGEQFFSAAVGNLSAAIPETANPGGPAIVAVVSGTSQTDSVRKSLAPLIARVTDQFGNPLPGIVVSWTRTGGGSLGGTEPKV